MSWLGKMIGGTIGFAIGGPIGAIAGAAFGHTFLDKNEQAFLQSPSGYKQRPHENLSSNEQAQLVFFTAAFSMLAKISKADGRVSEDEISAVEKFMKQDLQLDDTSRTTAQNIFRHAVRSNDSFDAFAIQFFSVFNNQPNILELMMDVLFRVSAADGSISPEEETMLRSAARIFQFSDNVYQQFQSRYVDQTDKFYAILKVSKDASNEEVKRQYRKLVSECHPDKIEAKGLPEEFVKLANEKFREIQEAYEAIRKERGF